MSKNAPHTPNLNSSPAPVIPARPPSRIFSLSAKKEHSHLNLKPKTSSTAVHPVRNSSIPKKTLPELPTFSAFIDYPLNFPSPTLLPSTKGPTSTTSTPKSPHSTGSHLTLLPQVVKIETLKPPSSSANPKQRLTTYVQSWFDFSPTPSITLPSPTKEVSHSSPPLPPFQLRDKQTWGPYFKSFPSHSFFLFTPWKPVPVQNRPTTLPWAQFSTYFPFVGSSWFTSFSFVHLSLIFLSILLLLIVLPIIPYFVGCEGPRKQSCLNTVNQKCEQTVICKNSGQADLDLDYTCSCHCPEGYHGLVCEFATKCPCLSSSSFNTCLGVFQPIATLYESEASSVVTPMTLDVVQLGMAFNLTQLTCEDQEKLFQVVPSSAPVWAKLAVAYHFQSSANFSSSKLLAEQFSKQLTSKSYKAIRLNGATYELEKTRVTFGAANANPSSTTDKFSLIQNMAKGLSELRQYFLLLFWTKYLDLPASMLQSFSKVASSQPVMIPLDSWQKVGSSTLIETITSSKYVGSPFCNPLTPSSFQSLNLAMEKSFGFPSFSDASSALQACLQRPTLGVFNLWRLRAGNYPSRGNQQAFVLQPSLKSMATVSAVPIDAIESNTQIGVFNGGMNHVWLDYFWNFPKQDVDLKALFTQFLNGGPLVDVEPSFLNVHVWSSRGVSFNATDIQLAMSSFYIRAENGLIPDPFFGTPQGQKFRTALKGVGIPLYWTKDALEIQSVLDQSSSEFTNLWDTATSVNDADKIWTAMSPKLNLFQT
ncbi:hypothetical protein HMI54_007447 [Coelomomyces lativittatus]|nr:hypothetical protein HMI56_001432 [Coelomomyces lativittatus]KAJ1516999.1 hypothetical protein HMI54_007447 [Coelomomyces lativittatus]KAJ1517409.1 hypothetical protein HMI55_007170 [Coelomomyces lativittatus]